MQKSYCQTAFQKDTSLAESNRIIGNALLEGLRYRDLYENEVNINRILKRTIALKDSLIEHKEYIINDLTTQLGVEPTYIITHDWWATGTISILSVIIAVALTLNLTE